MSHLNVEFSQRLLFDKSVVNFFVLPGKEEFLIVVSKNLTNGAMKNLRYVRHYYNLLLIWNRSWILTLQCRDWFPKFANGLNVIIDIVQKVYEWSSCPFAKMILQLGGHFDRKTPWSLIYVLYEQCLFWYLAHSQILGISLYIKNLRIKFSSKNLC